MSNKLREGLTRQSNKTTTHNGAVSNKSTLDSCVDLFGSIAAMRASTDEQVISAFTAAFGEDPRKALKILFWARDVRGGAGERKVSRTILKYLGDVHPKALRANLIYIPYFGRWDDLFCLRGTRIWGDAKQLILDQFQADLEEETPSILGKWMPSSNASSKATKALAREFYGDLEIDEKSYRKALVDLRSRLKVVEQKMCAGEWKDIEFDKVPSRAAMIYRNSFRNHAPKEYEDFLSKVERGESTIKADTLYPYDIVRSAINKNVHDRTLEAQWAALPNYVEPFNGIVVADQSASMNNASYYRLNKDPNAIAPIYVALSLALYIAERNSGPWKDCYIPFESTARLVNIKGSNFFEKLGHMRRVTNYWGSTNVQAVFDLILSTAVRLRLSQEDLPEKLFIVSDMQFDEAASDRSTNFALARHNFEAAGYTLPHVIFWNVNDYSDKPITIDDNGTCMVSGASPAILKGVLSAEEMNPVDVMDATIESERYSVIK